MTARKYIYSIISSLCRHLDIPVSDRSIRQSIEEQEDLLSLNTYREILMDFGIGSYSYLLNPEEIEPSYLPVIVHTHKEDEPFVILLETDEKQVVYYTPGIGTVKVSLEDFKLFFSGLTLIPFTNEYAGDLYLEENNKQDKREKYTRFQLILSVIVILLVTGIGLFIFQPLYVVWLFPLIILKILALGIVRLIIKVELNEEDGLARKLCKKDNCHKVLHSKLGNFFSWLSMGDWGGIYFGASLCSLFFSLYLIECVVVIPILAYINLLALPFSLISVFYQKFKVKSWCPLCLSIMGIFWIEFFIYLYGFNFYSLPVTWGGLGFVFFLHIVFLLGWSFFSRQLKAGQISSDYKQFVRLVKKNVTVFEALLSQQDKEKMFSNEKRFMLGDSTSSHQLTLIVKLGCPACFSLIAEVVAVLKRYPELMHVTIWFQKGVVGEKIVKLLYALLYTEEEIVIDHPLWHYFQGPEELLEKYLTEKKQLIVTPETESLYEKQKAWVQGLQLQVTPFILYNNKKLPVWYQLKDIVHIIKRMEE